LIGYAVDSLDNVVFFSVGGWFIGLFGCLISYLPAWLVG
jgi:hypothetical protein